MVQSVLLVKTGNEVYPGENREVPDPWYGGYENFKEVYELLDEACEKIVASHKS